MSRTINLGKDSMTMDKPKFDHCLFKGQTEISAQKCYVFVYVIYIAGLETNARKLAKCE